jgi:geranylgeranyl diphosphate synthase, type II
MSQEDPRKSPFSRFSLRLRPDVDEALEKFSAMGDSCERRLGEAINYALLSPGKRLRPLLVLAACDICGGQIPRAMPAAAAVEMIHAYSLVHDDLPAMDDDDLRRGRPTCHKVYGEAMAILAGDALLALAFETLSKLSIPAEPLVRAVRELAHAAGGCQLVSGQADDIEGAVSGEDIERLHSIHRKKTGAMIRVSLRLGAITAGASEERIDALDLYGDRLGLAFQITDDLLDVEGEENSMGKRLCKDLERGKLTYPGLLGLEESRREAKDNINESYEALGIFDEEATKVLKSLARFVLERNY